MNESFFTTHRVLPRVGCNTKIEGQKLSRSESRIFKKLENGVSGYAHSHTNHDLHVLLILVLHIWNICLNL